MRRFARRNQVGAGDGDGGLLCRFAGVVDAADDEGIRSGLEMDVGKAPGARVFPNDLGCRLLFDNPIDQQRVFFSLFLESPFGTFKLVRSSCLASFLKCKRSESHDFI